MAETELGEAAGETVEVGELGEGAGEVGELIQSQARLTRGGNWRTC